MKSIFWYKLLAHLASWLPLVWLVYAGFSGNLGGDPQTKLMHDLGWWGLLFLLLSLSITPLRRVSGVNLLIKFRRMLGLYSFFYLSLHLVTYFAFYLEFRWFELGKEIIERPYITVGFLAWLLMIPLTITSTKKLQRRLGRKWASLHKLVYSIAALGLVHYVWQSKSDLNEPLIYVTWGFILMIFRVKNWRRFLNWRGTSSSIENLNKGG